jgi:hypothetical protein
MDDFGSLFSSQSVLASCNKKKQRYQLQLISNNSISPSSNSHRFFNRNQSAEEEIIEEDVIIDIPATAENSVSVPEIVTIPEDLSAPNSHSQANKENHFPTGTITNIPLNPTHFNRLVDPSTFRNKIAREICSLPHIKYMNNPEPHVEQLISAEMSQFDMISPRKPSIPPVSEPQEYILSAPGLTFQACRGKSPPKSFIEQSQTIFPRIIQQDFQIPVKSAPPAHPMHSMQLQRTFSIPKTPANAPKSLHSMLRSTENAFKGAAVASSFSREKLKFIQRTDWLPLSLRAKSKSLLSSSQATSGHSKTLAFSNLSGNNANKNSIISSGSYSESDDENAVLLQPAQKNGKFNSDISPEIVTIDNGSGKKPQSPQSGPIKGKLPRGTHKPRSLLDSMEFMVDNRLDKDINTRNEPKSCSAAAADQAPNFAAHPSSAQFEFIVPPLPTCMAKKSKPKQPRELTPVRTVAAARLDMSINGSSLRSIGAEINAERPCASKSNNNRVGVTQLQPLNDILYNNTPSQSQGIPGLTPSSNHSNSNSGVPASQAGESSFIAEETQPAAVSAIFSSSQALFCNFTSDCEDTAQAAVTLVSNIQDEPIIPANSAAMQESKVFEFESEEAANAPHEILSSRKKPATKRKSAKAESNLCMSQRSSQRVRQRTEQWSCGDCSYHNPPSSQQCEMCEANRP